MAFAPTPWLTALAAPAGRVTPRSAPGQLSAILLVRDVGRPRLLEVGPGLVDRLRGGFGRALRAMAEVGVAGAADLQHVAFGDLPSFAAGRPLPRPLLLIVTEGQATLRVVCLLLGHARVWEAVAAEALERACAGGIALRPGGRHRVALETLAVETHHCEGMAIDPAPIAATLALSTPLVLRRSGVLKADGHGFGAALVWRMDGLLRWLDLALDLPEDLGDRLRALRLDTTGLEPVAWERWSASNATRCQTLAGFRGRLRLEGDLDWLWPLLRLGELLQVGGLTGLGCGRYRLIRE